MSAFSERPILRFTSAFLMVIVLGVPPTLAHADNASLLHVLKQRDFDTAFNLVTTGADPNERDAVGKTPLMVAAKRGHAGLVSALIDAGADVNASNNNGGTALMFASIRADTATVEALLAAGAQVNVAGANGWTALMVAAAKGHAPLVETLLSRGADANTADVYAWTPLLRAAGSNRLAVVEVLIRHGATQLGWRDDEGATALHRAAESGAMDVVDALLAAGLDAGARDASGRSAAQWARSNGHDAVAQRIAQSSAVKE